MAGAGRADAAHGIQAFAVGNHQVGRQLAVGEDKLPCQREQIHHAAAHVFGFGFPGFAVSGFGTGELGGCIHFTVTHVAVIARIKLVAGNGAAAFKADFIKRHVDAGTHGVLAAAAFEGHGGGDAVAAAELQGGLVGNRGSLHGQCAGG